MHRRFLLAVLFKQEGYVIGHHTYMIYEKKTSKPFSTVPCMEVVLSILDVGFNCGSVDLSF
jgi:hypothetical protein